MENEFNFAVGKLYRTRDHRQVRILATDRKSATKTARPIVGLVDFGDEENVYMWAENGRCYSDYTTNTFDIIGPWYEPPIVNWAAMPAWARWVAQDACGHWRWFACWPNRKHLPVLMDYLYSNIPPSYAPAYSGPWEDSLVERPAEVD